MATAKRHGVPQSLSKLLVDATQLRPYANNPRNGDTDAIVESLRANGQYRPIVVRRETGEVLAGNHTLAAALELGWTHLAATYVEGLSDDDAARIVLVDNRTNDLARYDDAQLIELLQSLPELDGTGFDDRALDKLLAETTARDYGSVAEQPHEIEPFTRYGLEQIVDQLVEDYAAVSFEQLVQGFYMPVGACLQELDRLAQKRTDELLTSDIGHRVADRWQPHRYDVKIPGKATAREQFNRADYRRVALKWCAETNVVVTDRRLLNALQAVRGAQTASNFRPAFALLMYRTYAPIGGRVLDTSCGFGGRMLGFLASRCSEYVGIDPAPQTQVGNRAMAAALAQPGKTVELIEQPAEDVELDTVGRESCDFAFTSPPYFGKERYAEGVGDETQSWKRYGDGVEWARGFLAPMLQLTHDALKPGAHALINIADVKIGKETYPLVDWTTQLGAAAGFDFVRIDRFPISRVPGRGDAAPSYEPIVVLRKPAR